uniref:AAA+ ATPase domain-containing protein n=1 Tax=Lotharella globosa TaxID=91324 RepID=A0A7S3ZBJ3_9EUKA
MAVGKGVATVALLLVVSSILGLSGLSKSKLSKSSLITSDISRSSRFVSLQSSGRLGMRYGKHQCSRRRLVRRSVFGDGGDDEPQDPDESLPDLLKQLMKKAADGKLPGDTQITFMDADKFAHLQDLKRKRQKKEEAVEKEREGRTSEALERIKNFDYRPKEIRDYLDRFVIKQSDAKKVLSIAICDHYNHVRRILEDPASARRDYTKPNVLLLGPTGVGKTYLMRNIAEFIGVPFVKADATKFSETGIVGRDAEDLVRDLVDKANGDKQLAEIGIIYIDEVDKIANPPKNDVTTTSGSTFNTRGVQNNLLKLMEDTEVSLQNPMAPQSLKSLLEQGGKEDKAVRTKNILFIFSGAFNGLNEKLKKEHGQEDMISSMFPHFGSRYDDDDEEEERPKRRSYLDKATTRDFIEAGMEPEFIGRVPVRCALQALLAEDLLHIMTSSEGSVLRQLEEDFKGYGIDLKFTDEALQEVAERSEAEQTGARGIVTVLENTLREFKFELPSLPFKEFTVDNQTVVDPKWMLGKMIESVNQTEVRVNDLVSFAEQFGRQHDPVQIVFSPEATVYLANLCVEKVSGFCYHTTRGSNELFLC